MVLIHAHETSIKDSRFQSLGFKATTLVLTRTSLSARAGTCTSCIFAIPPCDSQKRWSWNGVAKRTFCTTSARMTEGMCSAGIVDVKKTLASNFWTRKGHCNCGGVVSNSNTFFQWFSHMNSTAPTKITGTPHHHDPEYIVKWLNAHSKDMATTVRTEHM